jgi:hypothetical protein
VLDEVTGSIVCGSTQSGCSFNVSIFNYGNRVVSAKPDRVNSGILVTVVFPIR